MKRKRLAIILAPLFFILLLASSNVLAVFTINPRDWSIDDNVVFGIGSYTYQFNTRDTFGFAMKATWGQVNGEAREIFKDPKTGDGGKKSARGLLRVDSIEGHYILTDQVNIDEEHGGMLETVFHNGELKNEQRFEDIRKVLYS